MALLQHEVQRLLGRFLLCLQQYEKQLRSLVTALLVEGTLEPHSTDHAGRAARFERQPLGVLLQEFFAAGMSPTSCDEPILILRV